MGEKGGTQSRGLPVAANSVWGVAYRIILKIVRWVVLPQKGLPGLLVRCGTASCFSVSA